MYLPRTVVRLLAAVASQLCGDCPHALVWRCNCPLAVFGASLDVTAAGIVTDFMLLPRRCMVLFAFELACVAEVLAFFN